jgi:serine/threonine protein kinase
MATSDPLIGKKLGDYTIQSLLGRGGMARVYKGHDEALDRYAAVKVTMTDFVAEADAEEYKQRFLREARAIARLRHPHIVNLYQFGNIDDWYYMAMAFLDGEDLRVILKRYAESNRRMPLQDIGKMVREVASALDYAHKQEVIHRDIKPSNIMMTPDGAVLTDFGLALNLTEGTMGDTFGSAHYIAPEQAVSSSRAVPQSDLYSLGIILYEALTGKVPFDDPSAMSVALKHLNDMPPPPSMYNPALSPSLEAVIMKVLAKDPKQRYVSGAEMVADLDNAIAETESGAVEITQREKPAELKADTPPPPGTDLETKPMAGKKDTASTSVQLEVALRNLKEEQELAREATHSQLTQTTTAPGKKLDEATAPRPPKKEKRRIGLSLMIGIVLLLLLAGGIIGVVLSGGNGDGDGDGENDRQAAVGDEGETAPVNTEDITPAVDVMTGEETAIEETITVVASTTPVEMEDEEDGETTVAAGDSTQDEASSTPSPSVTPTEEVPTDTPEPATPTLTPTIPTDTPLPPTATATEAPTRTLEPSPTASPTVTFTRESSPTATVTATLTASATLSVTPALPPDIRLEYDEDSFKLTNISEGRLNVNNLVFVGDERGRFSASNWRTDTSLGNNIYSFRAEGCLFVLTESDTERDRCRFYNYWLLRGSSIYHFWTTANGNTTFRVVLSGETVAECEVEAGRCEFALNLPEEITEVEASDTPSSTPTASSTTPDAPPEIRLVYGDDSFQIVNISSRTQNIDGLVFEGDEQGQFSASAWRTGTNLEDNIYRFREDGCLFIITDATTERDRCRFHNYWLVRASTRFHFWRAAAGNETFTVSWITRPDEIIAECPVEAGECEFALP